MTYKIRKSIHGRQLAITTTGGIGGQPSTVSATDIGIDYLAQMWGGGMLTAVSSSGATITNDGVTQVSSASATARSFTLAAPTTGVSKEIFFDSSGSAVTLEMASSLVIVSASGAASATALAVAGAAPLKGSSVVLRGLSATRWQVVKQG